MLKSIKQLYANCNFTFIIAVLIAAFMAISFAACSKEDAPMTPEQKENISGRVWNVSVKSIKQNQEGTTKLVKGNNSDGSDDVSVASEDGWEDISEESSKGTKGLYMPNSNTIKSYWQVGEKVYVYWGGTKVGELTVKASGAASNETTLVGTISEPHAGSWTVSTPLQLYTISNVKSYKDQKGTIEDIASRFDYAQANVTITALDNANSTIKLSDATFQNLQSINYFSFDYPGSSSNKIKRLTITSKVLADGGMATIIPDTPTTDFYVALSNASYTSVEKVYYDFTAEMENGEIWSARKKANLKNGKFYAIKDFNTLVKYGASTPLTVEIADNAANGTITIDNPNGKTFFIKKNDEGQYNTMLPTITINVTAGDRVVLRGSSTVYGSTEEYTYLEENNTHIRCDVPHYIYGNIMSLVVPYNFDMPESDERLKEVKARGFSSLFYDNKQMYSHHSKTLLLPAEKVGRGAYYKMFHGCKNLTKAPDLPATTLDPTKVYILEGCYQAMFAYCDNLTEVPDILPATTLNEMCYHAMFMDCKSLTASPILPAEKLPTYCYRSMFQGCSSLKQITCYATDISGVDCLDNWVHNVSPTGIFIKNPETSFPSGPNGIPTGWKNDEPLTIEAIESGTITIFNSLKNAITYGKSINIGSATTSDSEEIYITVSAGDKVRLWGDTEVYGDDTGTWRFTNIRADCEHYIYGDIRSLISSDNYPNVTTLKPYAFNGLFSYNSKMRSHPTLTLRIAVEKVGEKSCERMFEECLLLERTPLLTATTLGTSCYENMFAGCDNLVEVTPLPAEIMKPYCYQMMFNRCEKLVDAPALPAMTLAEGCYANMFDGCISLENAPLLKATTLADFCYAAMFGACISLVNAPALPALNLAMGCYDNMFSGCKLLQTAPDLNAPNLVDYCYYAMFRDCSSLKTIKCLATNITADSCLEDWVEGVASSGKFTKKTGTVWPVGTSGIPAGWDVIEN